MKRSVSENFNNVPDTLKKDTLSKSFDNITLNSTQSSNSSNSLKLTLQDTCDSDARNVSPSQSSIIYKEITRSDIENIIGMKPIDLTKYKKAFVHKSVVKNAKESKTLPTYMHESYERFEFLGDSVLSLIVAKFLFKKYPNSQEGILTKIRTKLVNGKTLSMFANKLNLSNYLILNFKVENINGRNNNRILEDVFESLICSIYLDLGFDYAEKFVIGLIDKYINFEELLVDNNYKDILLRYCQNKFNCTPSYEISEMSGPPHNRTFKVYCYIQTECYKYGIAKCKKEAEQISARETLKQFNVNLD